MKFRLLLLLISATISFQSHAFKIDMHVAIGLEVLHDIESKDTITLIDIGEYATEERALRSVRTNPGAFLAGTVGPDFYPDLLVGQSLIHPGIEDGWKTKDFLKKLVDSAVTDKEYAFALGNMVHASSDIFAHTYVNTYAGDGFDLFDGEVDSEVRHIILEGFITKTLMTSEMKAKVISEFPSASLVPIDFIRKLYFEDSEILGQYNGGAASHIELINGYEKLIRRLKEEIDRLRNPIADEVFEIKAELDKLNAKGYDFAKYSLEASQACWMESKKVCGKYAKIAFGVGPCLYKKTVQNKICTSVSSLVDDIKDFQQYSSDLVVANEIFGPIEVTYQALLDLEESIINAKLALVTTSHNAAKTSLSGGSILDEYKLWLACHGLVFGGVPTQITKITTCGAYKNFKKLEEAYADLEKVAGPVMYGIVGYEAKKLIEEELYDYLEDATMRVSEELLGEEVIEVYEALIDPSDEGKLKYIFEVDESRKGLLVIEDVVNRVKYDFGGTNADIYSFPPTYNAIQLSKMVLLTGERLNTVISDLGGFPSYEVAGRILTTEIDTIDSNHQWLKLSPPLPKTDSETLKFDEVESPGMKFYYADNSSHNVFNSLFKGPIAPALEDPLRNGFTKLTDSKYTYEPCSYNPYPESETDNRCTIIPLIPIITGLMLNN